MARSFSVARCSNLPQSEFTENVGPCEGWPNDDCGEAGGRPAILEGELPGEPERARVLAGCPDIAASPTAHSLSWAGPLATAGVAVR